MLTQKYFEAIAHYQPGAAIIELWGELTAQAGESLDATYTTVENHQPEVIIFNFAGVDYLNSTGIAWLIGLLKQAQTTSCTLRLSGLRPFHSELLELAGLTEYMPILPAENGLSSILAERRVEIPTN